MYLWGNVANISQTPSVVVMSALSSHFKSEEFTLTHCVESPRDAESMAVLYFLSFCDCFAVLGGLGVDLLLGVSSHIAAR